MSDSQILVNPLLHEVCIVGLNSAFDLNHSRCYFGQIESISFLGIILQIDFEYQATTCLYINEEDSFAGLLTEREYIEFNNQNFEVEECVSIERAYDTSFHTLRMTAKELRLFVDAVLKCFLNRPNSYPRSVANVYPYKADWSDFGLQTQSHNDDYDDWHAYRGLKFALSFNSRGTCRRAEEMLNGKCFTEAHYQYFAHIVPLLSQLNAQQQ